MKTYETTCRVAVCERHELSPSDLALVEKAIEATRGSYAPYSRFCVGAAVLLSSGTVVVGSNQENAAYPSGLCAERVCLFAANAARPDDAPVALAIAARATSGELTREPTPPCGACRQVMAEVEQRYGRPLRVLLYGEGGIHIVESASHLLPLIFTLT